VAYFAASTDPAEKNKAFAESLGVDYPILSDADKATASAYGVLEEGYANRWTFYIGKDGKVLRIDRDVKPRTAGADVAAALESLKVDRAP
jgi:peroxiredoxin Q/BCP